MKGMIQFKMQLQRPLSQIDHRAKTQCFILYWWALDSIPQREAHPATMVYSQCAKYPSLLHTAQDIECKYRKILHGSTTDCTAASVCGQTKEWMVESSFFPWFICRIINYLLQLVQFSMAVYFYLSFYFVSFCGLDKIRQTTFSTSFVLNDYLCNLYIYIRGGPHPPIVAQYRFTFSQYVVGL